MDMDKLIVAFLLFGVIYSYFIYPILASLLCLLIVKTKNPSIKHQKEILSVSIVVAVYNGVHEIEKNT